jgi:hypothetical protein
MRLVSGEYQLVFERSLICVKLFNMQFRWWLGL